MHLRALLGLGLIVGVLLGLRVWTQKNNAVKQAELRESLAQLNLFEGIEPSDFDALQALVIDNVERNEQMRFERDGAGTWYMVDPVQWPAEAAVLKLLFDTVANDRGVVMPDITPSDAGLDPPKAVCRFDFKDKGRYTIEIGGVDLNEIHMFVRTQAPGGEPRLMRANRALEAIFDRFVPDYRSKVLVRDEPKNVVEIFRRGPATLPAPSTSEFQVGPAAPEIPNPLVAAQAPFDTLEMHLTDTEQAWRITVPYQALIDPQAMGMLAVTLCNVDAVAFPAEEAPDLSLFGLDRPELEVDVRFIDGNLRRFRFARPPLMRSANLDNLATLEGVQWVCQIDDRPQVFEVDPNVVLLCASPSEAFFDRRIARGELNNVTEMQVEAAGRRLTFEQDAGQWTVSGPTSTGQTLAQNRADKDQVEGIFLRLRQGELQDLLPDWKGAPTLVAERFGYTAFGRTLGGQFAPPMWQGAGPPPDERPALVFKRDGDQIWASVDPVLAEVLQTDAERYLDRELSSIPELDLGSIRITRAPAPTATALEAEALKVPPGEVLTFERDPATGRWNRAGESAEDRDFAVLVDRLRANKALGFDFGALSAPPQGTAYWVELIVPEQTGPRGQAGQRVSYCLVAGDAAGDWWLNSQTAARLFPGLVQSVAELFERR
jgi:hypothetical protein